MTYDNYDTRTLENAYTEAEALLAEATAQVDRAKSLCARMERNTQAAFIALQSRRAQVAAFVASCNQASAQGREFTEAGRE